MQCTRRRENPPHEAAMTANATSTESPSTSPSACKEERGAVLPEEWECSSVLDGLSARARVDAADWWERSSSQLKVGDSSQTSMLVKFGAWGSRDALRLSERGTPL